MSRHPAVLPALIAIAVHLAWSWLMPELPLPPEISDDLTLWALTWSRPLAQAMLRRVHRRR